MNRVATAQQGHPQQDELDLRGRLIAHAFWEESEKIAFRIPSLAAARSAVSKATAGSSAAPSMDKLQNLLRQRQAMKKDLGVRQYMGPFTQEGRAAGSMNRQIRKARRQVVADRRAAAAALAKDPRNAEAAARMRQTGTAAMPNREGVSRGRAGPGMRMGQAFLGGTALGVGGIAAANSLRQPGPPGQPPGY